MNNLILTFLIANTLFWGLFPHNAHCLLLENINKLFQTSFVCQPHKVHLFMGLLFYIASVYYAQKDNFDFKSLMA